MIKKLIKHSVFTLLIAMSLNTSFAAPFTGGADSNLTGAAGTLIGTVPSVSNASGETGKIDFIKNDKHDPSRQLYVGDNVTLSWNLIDSEGDADDSVSSVVWRCDHPQKGQRILATGVDSYTITSKDLGCFIGISLQPQTLTGDPRENDLLTIDDISSYYQDDNIVDGPVAFNPHAITITEYTVAPGTTQSKTVEADLILHTGWNGAKLQLETDNVASEVTWKSSNEEIATVSSSGLVTFKAKGAVTFTVSNGEATNRITFNPDLFYVFSTVERTWYEASDWCAEQGYSMPAIGQLSAGANKREIPFAALWQEWGNVSVEGANVAGYFFWSGTEWSPGSLHADYMDISDGYITTNGKSSKNGAVCLVP